jgi:NADH dehydrogenase (ubiquinone) flavoprotein 2
MMVISDYSNPPNFRYDFFEDLTFDSMMAVLNNLKEGKPVKVGTQNPHRKNISGPEGGKTTLLIKEPPGPYCRDLDPPKKEEPKK